MGGNSGFWSKIRHLKQPLGGTRTRGQRAQQVLVDASVFVHALHGANSELAWKVFTADPKYDCTGLIEEYARALMAAIQPLADGK